MLDGLILKPASKKEIEAAAYDFIRELVNSGEFDLAHYAKLKRAEIAVAAMLLQAKKKAIELVEVYNKNEPVKFDGVLFSTYSQKPTLDYEDDMEYRTALHELEYYKAKVDERKELLDQAFEAQLKGRQILDDSGEIVTPPKVKKQGSQILKATL